MAIDQTIHASATAYPAGLPSVPVATAARSTGAGSSTHGVPAAVPQGGFSFRTFLSDINPLQYIPVVGAIYRAATGDEGNADLRFVASLGTSFALGGPVGVGITVAEKVSGIDPEIIGRRLLSRLFHHPARSAVDPAANSVAAALQPTRPLPVAIPPPEPTAGASDARAWTGTELSAYGVTRTADNGLAAGGLSGADVLNTLELQRLSTRYA